MATTNNLDVVLKLQDGTELPFIAGFTAQQNLDHYSMNNPKLTTATVDEPVTTDKKVIYNVRETLGTKG